MQIILNIQKVKNSFLALNDTYKRVVSFLSLCKEIKNLNGKGMDDNNLITRLQQGDKNTYKQLFIK